MRSFSTLLLKSLLIAVAICGVASAQVSFEKQRDAIIFRAVQVFSVDLNNDHHDEHHDDLISLPVSDNATTLAVSLANRDGTFRAGPTYDTGTTATRLVSGEFNHDGHADIAFISQNALTVFLGNGDGSLHPGFTFPLSLRPFGIATADFNLDGNQDLAILGQFKVGPRPGVDYAMQVVIFFGDGAGGFTEPSTVFSDLDNPSFPPALLTGDFNGDHIPDFAFSFTTGDRANRGTTVIHVLYGADTLKYVDTQATYAFAPVDEIASDVNSDGRSDLLISFVEGPNIPEGLSEGIAILYGTDARTFVRKDLDTPGRKLGVADFNGDGRNDVVATFSNYPQSGVDVLVQQSDGTFATPQQYVVTSGGDAINLAIGDFNGDSKPDIAVPIQSPPFSSGFAVELMNTTPPTTPLLTALSPLDGASVASSFWVRVDAASARRITGMIVYVDGVTTYVTTQSFVDAVLPLTTGAHHVTVRAWNEIGQFGTYTASIQVVGNTSTVPLLQVSSPGNDHLVPSPLWVRVNATSPAGIAGIIVYIDSVPKFTTTAAFVDKTFPVGAGIHSVTVRGWNSKGEFSTYQARIGATQASSAPVAYVYVASYVNSNNRNQINGYVAASDGSLTAIPGSPFPYDVNSLALNRDWLFAVNSTGREIDSFSIGSNGALALKNKYPNPINFGFFYDLFLDHTGATLYADDGTGNNDYLSQSIDRATGHLTNINDLAGGPHNNSEMSFIGNNQYAYSSSCYHFTPVIFGVQRASDGALSWLSINPPLPAEKSGGFYCPWLAAADPTNHLAVAMQPLTDTWGYDGPTQLAVYTADGSGNLTTSSTYENMPSVFGWVRAQLLDLSGRKVPGSVGTFRTATVSLQWRESNQGADGIDRHWLGRSGLLG